MRLHIMSPRLTYNTAQWRLILAKHRKASK